MLTKIKKMFVLVMFAAFVFALVGCGGGISGALKALTLDAEVTEDFTLPTANLEGAVTTWTSNNDAIVIDGTYAEVVRPSLSDVEVTLTATVTLGEKSESKDFVIVVKCLEAPEAIKIKTGTLKPVEGEANTYYLVMGTTVQLSIEVADENESTEVVWSVSNGRVKVSEDGVLEGVKYGVAEITATSTSTAGGVAITDKIKVEVVEHENPQQVLLNNKKAIENEIPRFISSDFTFPMAPNGDVETTYYLGQVDESNKLYYGEYVYVEGVDRQETLYCSLKYKDKEIEFEFVISVVADEEDNEFLALDYAQAQLDAIFGPYLGQGAEKVATDIEVPGEFTAEEAMYDVAISYDSVTDYKPVPIDVNTVKDDEGTEKLVAQYTKPNDDCVVRVEAYFKTANVDRVVRYSLTAAGYTKSEIVEYLSANVLPQPAEDGTYSIVCSHITLPTSDTTGKFGKVTIEWESSDESTLTKEGKFANLKLDKQTKVTLTANIKYAGTINDIFAFEDSVSFEFDVYPAENKAQAVALELSSYIDAPEFFDQLKYFPFGKVDRLDANGQITNVMPLPKKVSDLTTEMAEYKDLAITWAATEEGLIDENGKLLKQYLRYHEAVLVYAIEVEGVVATGEVVINVGITEVKNTIYLGGNWYQQSATGENSGDVLCQLSKFDGPVGTLGTSSRTWGYSYGRGEFQGTTWYIDVYEVDEDGNPTKKFTRYQYFAHNSGFMTLDDQYKIELSDPANPKSGVITLNEELNKYIGSNYGGNWAAIYHNVTDHDVKVPMAPLSAQPFLGNAEVQWQNHPWTQSNVIGRDNAFAIDGYRVGFVMDKDGKVITASGSASQFQVNYDADGDGQLTDADYWVTIPAGGYAYTPRTQQNAGDASGTYLRYFCQVDAEIKVSYFDPYFSSPDGSSEGLGTFVHQ